MTRHDQLILNENIRFRRVGDEGVVVDQRSAEVMVISEVAIRTLELIRETKSMKSVLDGIVDEFEVSQNAAQADLALFFESLNSRDMLQAEDPDVSS